jgi:hypothetical protein
VIGDEDDEDDKSLQSDRSIYIDGCVRDDRDLALKLAHQSPRRLLENSCFLPQRAAAQTTGSAVVVRVLWKSTEHEWFPAGGRFLYGLPA